MLENPNSTLFTWIKIQLPRQSRQLSSTLRATERIQHEPKENFNEKTFVLLKNYTRKLCHFDLISNSIFCCHAILSLFPPQVDCKNFFNINLFHILCKFWSALRNIFLNYLRTIWGYLNKLEILKWRKIWCQVWKTLF